MFPSKPAGILPESCGLVGEEERREGGREGRRERKEGGRGGREGWETESKMTGWLRTATWIIYRTHCMTRYDNYDSKFDKTPMINILWRIVEALLGVKYAQNCSKCFTAELNTATILADLGHKTFETAKSLGVDMCHMHT